MRAVQNLTLAPLPYGYSALEPVRPCLSTGEAVHNIQVCLLASYSSPCWMICTSLSATVERAPLTGGGATQYIDTATMKLHHDVHNQAYVTNTNNALATAPAAAKDLTLLGLNHNVGTDTFGTTARATAIRCVLQAWPAV